MAKTETEATANDLVTVEVAPGHTVRGETFVKRPGQTLDVSPKEAERLRRVGCVVEPGSTARAAAQKALAAAGVPSVEKEGATATVTVGEPAATEGGEAPPADPDPAAGKKA